MENDVLVSVVCLTYNQEKYIRRAIESFLSQRTNFKYEILINDDASTDETANIIREYEMKYPDYIKPTYQSENQYTKGIK
ncbi:glycosyltransferase family A protein, partial [[Clostridium] symbiosum]